MNSASPVDVNAFNQLVLSTKNAFSGSDALNFGSITSHAKTAKAAFPSNAHGFYQANNRKNNSSTRVGDNVSRSYSKKISSSHRGNDT